MHLPQAFTDRILAAFGDRGRQWLAELPQILSRCIERWRLGNIAPGSELSYNLISFAVAPDHGAVVLKIGVPHPELFTEMEALRLMAGRGICDCYDAAPDLVALLLRRIEPGTDLTAVQDRPERFRIAGGLIRDLPVLLPGAHGLPHYAEWMDRAFGRARREGRAIRELLELAGAAEQYWPEIQSPGRPDAVLHGDLHHMNMLLDRHGGWTAIDPKGVVGAPCLEAARFMINEFRMGEMADRLDRLDQMAAAFATRLGETRRLLGLCAFVDRVLSACWSVEEGMPAPEQRAAAEEAAALLGYSLHAQA